MSQLLAESPPPESKPFPRSMRSGRVARLTLKELRETLRDRRTLITLVLMPLLLYPLLSLILRKFLITSAVAGAVPIFHIAFPTEKDAQFVSAVMETGRGVLAARQRQEPLPNLQMFVSTNPDQSLFDGEVDVVVRVLKMPVAAYDKKTSWEADCELQLIDGSISAEKAARHVEDCMRICGTRVVGARLREAGIQQRANPIRAVYRRIKDNSPSSVVSLAAVIPFVLVLMTITGAVYPAIDLTAGERERGTLELLVAAPVPRLGLLFAKYVAVMTVSMLTATVNLIAMTGTVLVSGLGPMLWGSQGLTIGTVVAVFFLLLLLASFFSAVLLAITSFARSFKEAQAYLIPVMLCALGPGLISLMPGVNLNGWLVVAPLLNIALLARDILQGEASWILGLIVVASTGLYAFAALALAAKLFAADAVLYDARIGWTELWRRPKQAATAGIALAMMCLACMFPILFAALGAIATMSDMPIFGRLVAIALATGIVFGGVPLVFAYWRRIAWDTGLQWRLPPWFSWLGAGLLGLSLWPFAHEVVIFTQRLGLVSLDAEHFARAKALIEQCRAAPLWLVLLAFAVAPAVFEEFCFRGFVFSALRSRLTPWSSILASGFLFGIFHLVTTDALAIERFIPSTLLGIALGWVCYRTASVFPGMVLHAFHNGFLTLVFYYLPELKSRGWGVEQQEHIPWTWLGGALLCAACGFAIVYFASRRSALPAPSVPR